MEARIVSSFIETRSSRGIVRGFQLSVPLLKGGNVAEPINDYRILDSMVRNDEILSAAFDATVEMVSRNGYDFAPLKGTDSASKEIDRAIKLFNDLEYPEVLNNIVYSMLYYGDCFLELRRATKEGIGKVSLPAEGRVSNSTEDTTPEPKPTQSIVQDTSGNKGEITELNVLETTEMRIVYDEHGKVLWYVQRPFNTVGLTTEALKQKEIALGVWFRPEDIIHYTMKKVGSGVYSQTPIESIARQWSTKLRANTYLLQAFQNLPPEMFIHLKGANKVQRDDFASLLQRRKQRAGLIPISYGAGDSGLEIKTSEFAPSEGILKVLNYLTQEVLLITRCPPTWLGLKGDGGSNRGDSESMLFSFEVKVESIKQKVQFRNNRSLMKALGFENIEFNFNPSSSRNEKEVVENAAVFHSMNIKPEAIVKYLKRNGITDILPDDFEEPPLPMPGMGMGGGMASAGSGNQTASNKLSPSRRGMNPRTDSMKSSLGKGGSSVAGKAKTAEKNKKQR